MPKRVRDRSTRAMARVSLLLLAAPASSCWLAASLAPSGGQSGASASDSGVDGSDQDGKAANIGFVKQNANSGAGSSVSVSLKGVKAADSLVVWVNFDPTSGADLISSTPVVDNLETNYGTSRIDSYYGAGLVNYIYVAFNVQEGDRILTVSLTKAPGPLGLEIYLMEYSGMRRLDDTAMDSGTGMAGQTISSGSVTTSVASELILGLGTAYVLDAGPGFTPRSNYNQNVVEDRIAGPARQSYQATAVLEESAPWVMIVAAFE
jgi:hypothetical protein